MRGSGESLPRTTNQFFSGIELARRRARRYAGMMFNRLPLVPLLSLLMMAPFTTRAAASTTQEQEYEQMRKVALRDPKVRAAYEEADRKLEAKILQIDPALASYHHHPSQSSAATANTAAAAAQARPTPKPVSVATQPFQRSYVVVKGDTLTSISAKYAVTVAALKTTNHITDERKLGVGQVLAVPNGKETH